MTRQLFRTAEAAARAFCHVFRDLLLPGETADLLAKMLVEDFEQNGKIGFVYVGLDGDVKSVIGMRASPHVGTCVSLWTTEQLTTEEKKEFLDRCRSCLPRTLNLHFDFRHFNDEDEMEKMEVALRRDYTITQVSSSSSC
ncbi:hypothetical protein D6833_00090 [Candidatus Parcubacteria bacterium]|nr:MAG: hypothetical protein D6833_00090 [Candidatus Parcubacteria bacterium]